jgi:hypothetical protein
MARYDDLSSEELFDTHDRTMEGVADCLHRTERLLQQSHRLIRSSDMLLEQAPKRHRRAG